MSVIITVILLFILGSFIGYQFEYAVWGKSTSNTVLSQLAGKQIDALPIYGIGLVIVYLGLKLLNHVPYVKNNILAKAIIMTGVISTFECFSGLIAEKVFGRKWNYNSGICKGYISLETSAVWFAAILIITALV